MTVQNQSAESQQPPSSDLDHWAADALLEVVRLGNNHTDHRRSHHSCILIILYDAVVDAYLAIVDAYRRS